MILFIICKLWQSVLGSKYISEMWQSFWPHPKVGEGYQSTLLYSQ